MLRCVKQTAEEVRTSFKPVLIEALTYRLLGHSKSDTCEYRSEDEENEWKSKDPINRYKAYLNDQGIDSEAIKEAEKEAHELVEDAVSFAEQSPFPG